CTAGGLGFALAKEAHAKGLRVFACSRTLESMAPLAEMGIETLVLDVTRERDIQEVKAVIAERTGRSMFLSTTRDGIADAFAVSDFSMVRVRHLYDVNLFGAIGMTHALLPLLRAARDHDVCVVLVSSLASKMPIPFNAAYNSAKAALNSFGDTLRVEMAPFGVNVLNVLSGNVQSNIMKPTTLPDNSIYQPIKDMRSKVRCNCVSYAYIVTPNSQLLPEEGATPADVWAKAVIAESLKRKPRDQLWIGQNWFMVWFVSTFLPRRVSVSGYTYIYFVLFTSSSSGHADVEDVWDDRT
ncbi:hypothetical protein GGX14DRAFT_363383, partial [Mycena pura]